MLLLLPTHAIKHFLQAGHGACHSHQQGVASSHGFPGVQVCDALTRAEQALCPGCLAQPQLAVGVLHARAAALERALQQLVRVPLFVQRERFRTFLPERS